MLRMAEASRHGEAGCGQQEGDAGQRATCELTGNEVCTTAAVAADSACTERGKDKAGSPKEAARLARRHAGLKES